ncbi:hypothetical protein [Burkholderia ubonensis]|uniref:hypothetical protein n=1 Tax=Burkholderia ubonensis TaxID=101571 RepID=UPI0012F80DDE|nr:hypothetical protein [Burkholderia ubonensis]
MVNIVCEVWDGAKSSIFEKENPSLEECLDAIKKMDGITRTLTAVNREGFSLMVGGGGGMYIITCETGNLIKNLVDYSGAGDLVDLTVGGQACTYPGNYVVNFDLARKAISNEFFDGNDQLTWEVLDK